MTAAAESLPIFASGSFHLTVERTNLLKALSHCQGVVERRNTVPILSHVLLEAWGGTLKVIATDLEIALIETIPAHVMVEGSTTISANLLFEIVRKLPDGAEIELKMDEEGSSLNLLSGRSSYDFACLPSTDFPPITEEKETSTFKLHAAELSRLIDRTRFSMSTEETRYYLNGIFFHPTPEGTLRAVATDGLRLAQAQVELPPEAAGMPHVIISRKTINEIRKLIDESAEEITLALSENQVRFTVGLCVLFSRLIEGKYPDYERVIPVGNDKVLEVDVKAFADAIDRVATMSTDKLRPVKMRVEGKILSLSAHRNEGGQALEELEVTYTGTSVDFGFNARFILDVTQQIASPTLQMLIGDETQAIIVKDAADDSALYVLMPMRV